MSTAVATSFTDMLCKGRWFEWTDDGFQAVYQLKTALTFAPVLHNADFIKPFSIHCDAGKNGIGVFLDQIAPKGDDDPTAFMLQKLTALQRIKRLRSRSAWLPSRPLRSSGPTWRNVNLKWSLITPPSNG